MTSVGLVTLCLLSKVGSSWAPEILTQVAKLIVEAKLG